jgi:hypothetical protein
VALGKTSKKAFTVVAVAFAMFVCSTFGFISCLHLKSAPSAAMRQKGLAQPGDASAKTRARVMAPLQALQQG